MLAMILAGGRGTRLHDLTKKVAKPAVSYGGKYRIIDFKRTKDGIPAKVATIEYDPNRTCFIALIHYADGEKSYILAPIGLKVGDTVKAGQEIVVLEAMKMENSVTTDYAGTVKQILAHPGDNVATDAVLVEIV